MNKSFLTKFLIIFLFVIFGFSMQNVNAAEPMLNVILPMSGFLDIPEKHWAETEITDLYRRGIIAGYPDNKFHPERYITRAEFATLAIRALRLDDQDVVDTLVFDDFFPTDWAWRDVQNAYYFGMLTPPRMDSRGLYLFRPDDNITRAHAITIAVNALKVQPISKRKAKAVLEYRYEDFFKIPDWFLTTAGKAEILNMLVVNPTKSRKLINAEAPITRGEAAVLIYNMLEEAITNPNDKIKAALTKKQAVNGHILTEAYIEDEVIATIPRGTTLPLVISGKISSQNTTAGEKYVALVPKNYIHASKTLLIPYGTKFYGHVKQAQKGRFLRNNATIILENDKMEILKQPAIPVQGIIKVSNPKANTKTGKLFKGKKLTIDRGSFLEMELLQDIKIDVSNGKIIKYQDL